MESIGLTQITTASIGGGASCFCSFRRKAESSICFRRGRRKVGGGFLVYPSKGDVAMARAQLVRPDGARFREVARGRPQIDPRQEIPGKIVNEKSPVSSPTVDANKADSNFKSLPAASLLQKPRRFDRLTKAVPPNDGLQTSEEKISMEDDDANLELAGMSTASSLDDLEEADWARAEDLVKTGENMEVELLRSSTKGFMVSFGLLIGFLPFGNLAARWKFLAFESWLRQKGLDPSMYWQNLGVIGIYDPRDNYTSSIGGLDPDNISVNKGEISPDTKLEDLLKVYDQEKLKFFVYIY